MSAAVQPWSGRVTIFEGPDGSGKTTLARAFAAATGARYVHCGPLPHLRQGLARAYAEAMLPAALGHQDVVLDRCWLSEPPYGRAFRGGLDRLGRTRTRMLERLAARCGATVVLCLPPYDTVRANYLARRKREMLETEAQLRQVYASYEEQLRTDLPTLTYDYGTDERGLSGLIEAVQLIRPHRHLTTVASAGFWHAPVALVGEAFGEPKEHDPLYQWPFASFTGGGCSEWLTQQLELEGIAERQLLWVNADQDLGLLDTVERKLVVALGAKAEAALYRDKIVGRAAPHPQAWKRFNHGQRYPLLDLLKEHLT